MSALICLCSVTFTHTYLCLVNSQYNKFIALTEDAYASGLRQTNRPTFSYKNTNNPTLNLALKTNKKSQRQTNQVLSISLAIYNS